jgi:hypothetical protein
MMDGSNDNANEIVTNHKDAVKIGRCQSTVVPEEMHDEIFQGQMRKNAKDGESIKCMETINDGR